MSAANCRIVKGDGTIIGFTDFGESGETMKNEKCDKPGIISCPMILCNLTGWGEFVCENCGRCGYNKNIDTRNEVPEYLQEKPYCAHDFAERIEQIVDEIKKAASEAVRKAEESSKNEMPKLNPGMLIELNGEEELFIVGNILDSYFDCAPVSENIDFFGYTSDKDGVMAIYDSFMLEDDMVGDSKIIKYKRIWKRRDPKEMTVSEISKELGYDVKIVDG